MPLITKIIASLVVLFISFINNKAAVADNQSQYSILMDEWNKNKDIASKLLLEAEGQFKDGDEISGCSTQRKASEYGIKATNSLIEAMKANQFYDGLENLEAGLNKWKELRDLC